MPRVIITTNKLDYGGAERQRVTLANGLSRFGRDVEIRLLQSAGPLLELVDGAVSVRQLRRYWSGLVSVRRRVLITGTTKTEVWHGFLAKFSSLGRDRWIVAVHNPIPRGERLFGRLRTALINMSDVVVHLSPGQAQELLANSRVRGRRSVAIANGIETDGLLRALGDRGVRRSATPVVVFVGRITEQKGLDVMLTALLQCTDLDWRVMIAGDGPQRGALEAGDAARELGARVTWLGSVPVADALIQGDALILPSRNEAYPLVLLEAAIAGLPIIATDVGAVSSIMDRAVGLVCPPNDALALGAAVRELLSDLSHFGAAASARRAELVEEFGADRMVEQYDRLVRSLC
ncbi:glycosyltransferase [Modestobacter sp. URMC 112]